MRKLILVLLFSLPMLCFGQDDLYYLSSGDRTKEKSIIQNQQQYINDYLSTIEENNVTFKKPQVLYFDGERTLSYQNKNVSIMLSASLFQKYYGLGSELRISMVIENKNYDILDFNPAQITAFYIEKGNIKNIDVYTVKKYMSKVRSRILWFGPSSNEGTVGKSTTTIENKYGGTEGTISTTVSGYTGDLDEAISHASSLKAQYLKRNSIFKGNNISGFIALKRPKVNSFIIKLALADETFYFPCILE